MIVFLVEKKTFPYKNGVGKLGSEKTTFHFMIDVYFYEYW